MNLPISELQQTHPDYDPAINSDGSLRALQTYSDFYGGGRHFEKHKNKYLRQRPIESVPTASAYRSNRLGCAYFTPHAGGMGANLCGTALQYPPTFEVKSGDERAATYWRSLNTNADGNGSDTRAVAWCLMDNLIMHRRAYIVVNFPYGPDDDEHDEDDATFTALGAREVDDWQTDDAGKYLWVRTHCVDLTRSKGVYAPQDTEQHTWTFYTASETVEYIASRPIGGSFPATDGKEAMATAQPPKPHGLGVVPVFPIEVEDNFWVMDRLFSTALAYFNREASRSFAIDTGALTLPVLKTTKDVNGIVTANGFCIKLGIDPGEDFFWRSPDSGIYDALQKDCEYLLGNLYGALNQMALTAAGKEGNPRQSGTAKTADAASIKAFLSLLCSPIMAAWRKAMKAVQKYREEENEAVECNGMSNFDVQSIELEINRCATFNSIPGMPQTARKESMKKSIRAYLPDIDDDAKEAIETEFVADLPEVQSKQDEVVGAASPASGITNATTQRPQGFAPGQVSQKFTKQAVPVGAA